MDNFVKTLIEEVKSQGVFDEFRFNCCLADVDTKPAYQNVRNRVETAVKDFLAKQHWTPETNKVQLRERLRKHLLDSDVLDKGVDQIVDQVVNPKVATIFEPKIESIAYKYLGITPPLPPVNDKHLRPPPLLPAPPLPPYTLANGSGSLLKVETTASLLPTDLEQISPDSDRGTVKSDIKEESKDKDDLPPGVEEDDTSPSFEALSEGKLKEEEAQNGSLNTSDSVNKDLANDSRDAGASQVSQLSQVSSDSRLTIASSIESAVDAPQHQQPTQNLAANMSEEAQMPKFSENSNEASHSGRQLHFDIKQDAITFKGPERKNSIKESTNGEVIQPFSIEDAIMSEVKANIDDANNAAIEPEFKSEPEPPKIEPPMTPPPPPLTESKDDLIVEADSVKVEEKSSNGELPEITVEEKKEAEPKPQDEKKPHSRDKSKSRHHSHSDDKQRHSHDKSHSKHSSSSSTKHSSSSHSSSSKHKSSSSSSSKNDKNSSTSSSSRSKRESSSSSKRSSNSVSRHESSSSSSSHKKHKSSSSSSRSDREKVKESHSQSRSTHNGGSSSSKSSSSAKKSDKDRSHNKSTVSTTAVPVIQDDHTEAKVKLQQRRSSDSNDEGKPPGTGGGAQVMPNESTRITASTVQNGQTSNGNGETNGNSHKDVNQMSISNVIVVSDILQQSSTSFIELGKGTQGQKEEEPKALEEADAAETVENTGDSKANEEEVQEAVELAQKPNDDENLKEVSPKAEIAQPQETDKENEKSEEPPVVKSPTPSSEEINYVTHFEENGDEFKARLELINKLIEDHENFLNKLSAEEPQVVAEARLARKRQVLPSNHHNNNNNNSISSSSASGSAITPPKIHPAKRLRRDEVKSSPTPSEASVNSKENEAFEKQEQQQQQRDDGQLSSRRLSLKLCQQQRYTNDDLYKPRPVLSQRSRRRGLDAII